MPSWALPPDGFEGPQEVPEWDSVPETEEVIYGFGTIPEGLNGEDEGENQGQGQGQGRGQGGRKEVPGLVRGVGMVDLLQDGPLPST